MTEPIKHPNAYTPEELTFLRRLRISATRGVILVTRDEFNTLQDLLGRCPSYDLDSEGRYDYSKPITINSRYTIRELEEAGYEHVLLNNLVVLPRL